MNLYICYTDEKGLRKLFEVTFIGAGSIEFTRKLLSKMVEGSRDGIYL